MQKGIKISVENSRILISEVSKGFEMKEGYAGGSDIASESNLIATVDKSYLWGAIMFAKQDDILKHLTDMVASLRIARDESADSNATQTINAQIESMVKFIDSLKDAYNKYYSLIKQ